MSVELIILEQFKLLKPLNSCSAFDWKARYEALHASFPGTQHTPVIGITGNFGDKGCELAEGYYESVLRVGATPVVLPPTEDGAALATMLDRLDGLILSGGGDMNPLFMGEEPIPNLHSINPKRDLAELLLIRMAYNRQLPMLGICRGIQMLAAALDGTVWQDLDLFIKSPDYTGSTGLSPLLKHSQDLDRAYASHTVKIEKNSLLHRVMQCDVLPVNSFHHQAVREAGPHLRVCATSSDGVIEAVESSEHKSILGVQWHPECFCLRGDETMMPLFRWLKDEAANYHAARRIHSRILTLDSHCDTPMFFDQDIHFDHRDPKILVDLHKMTEGGLDASTMVAYIPQGPLTDEGRAAATDYAKSQLSRVEEMVQQNAAAVGIAYSAQELYQLKSEGRKAIMLGIENGYAIGKDLHLLEDFFKKFGIVYMTLCHNGNNDICGSARPREGEPLMGVTAFGADVIRKMNRLGIMVDLSHASERSFYDALEMSTEPIVCSHSSCRALCDHPRNLTDDQMRKLADKGGVMQITFYNGFLRTDGQASILDAVAHLNHAVQVMGIAHVGIGTDFDGDGGVPGLASASELINLTRRLLRERYSEADLRLIWGGNWLRCMGQQP